MDDLGVPLFLETPPWLIHVYKPTGVLKLKPLKVDWKTIFPYSPFGMSFFSGVNSLSVSERVLFGPSLNGRSYR